MYFLFLILLLMSSLSFAGRTNYIKRMRQLTGISKDLKKRNITKEFRSRGLSPEALREQAEEYFTIAFEAKSELAPVAIDEFINKYYTAKASFLSQEVE